MCACLCVWVCVVSVAASGPPGLHTTVPNVHISGPRRFKNTTKIQRKDPQEREERKKIVAKNAKFWAHHPSGTHNSGPTVQVMADLGQSNFGQSIFGHRVLLAIFGQSIFGQFVVCVSVCVCVCVCVLCLCVVCVCVCLCVSVCVCVLWCCCCVCCGGFGAAGASHDSPRTPNVHISGPWRFKNTTKIQRKDTQEREERKKIVAGVGKKKARNFGPPHPSGRSCPHLAKPHLAKTAFGQKNPNLANLFS